MKENLLYERAVVSKLIHRVDDDGDEYVIKVLNVLNFQLHQKSDTSIKNMTSAVYCPVKGLKLVGQNRMKKGSMHSYSII